MWLLCCQQIFGAFCSGPWYERRSNSRNICYFGTGETFLFTLSPERNKYEWVGILSTDIPKTANMFLAGDNSCLTIGGGWESLLNCHYLSTQQISLINICYFHFCRLLKISVMVIIVIDYFFKNRKLTMFSEIIK